MSKANSHLPSTHPICVTKNITSSRVVRPKPNESPRPQPCPLCGRPGWHADMRNRRAGRQNRLMAELGFPNFETLCECETRQVDLIKRLQQSNCAPCKIAHLMDCQPGNCPKPNCSEACHFKKRDERFCLISATHKSFKKRTFVYQVVIVNPRWTAGIGEITSKNFRNAHRWVTNQLKLLNKPNIWAIGSFERCVNVELDGSRHWSGEMTLIVAGATEAELKSVFSIVLSASARPNTKPVRIDKVDNLARQLGYALKRFAEQRVAYIDDQGRQNRNHLPLPKTEQVEFDQWLLGLKSGQRVFLFGLKRYGRVLRRTNRA